MADFELLAPGGHQKLVDEVVDRLDLKPDSDGYYAQLTAGAALGITGNVPTESAAWLQRVSTSDGPTTIHSIHGNTIVQDGELVPVNMVGIETTGFNQWDEEWELGSISDTTGELQPANDNIRSKNFIPCFSFTEYYCDKVGTGGVYRFYFYDSNKTFIGSSSLTSKNFTTPANSHYMKFRTYVAYGTTYNNDICINISDPTRNGEYVPYWQQERTIPAGTLRGAGTVYDEQTETERITRVGECVVDGTTVKATGVTAPKGSATAYRFTVPLPNATFTHAPDFKTSGSIFEYSPDAVTSSAWKHGDATFNAWGGTPALLICIDGPTNTTQANTWLAEHPFTVDYPVTPTVTPIDPPINMTYRTEQGGTERVMVPTGEQSAPPTLVTAQGYTAESLRDAALSAIAPVENGIASTNYGVGSYLVHGGQLCKVTTAIATGEAITIGTNVTATTVMAEILSLVQ